MDAIDHIEKENTAVVIPNAIRVYMINGEEILFGSYIDRDPCYDLLSASIEAEKHYSLIKAEGQSHATNMEGVTAELSILRSSAAVASPSLSASDSTSDEADDDDGGDDEGIGHRTVSADGGPGAMESHLRDVASAEDLTSLADTQRDSAESRESSIPQIPLSPVFMRNREVTLLQDEAIRVPVASVWDTCWRDGDGYASFLCGMGDFDVQVGEWEDPTSDGGGIPCPEDTSELTFVAKRDCEYMHPRTSMLMFGPRNAPAKQIQYLFLQGKGVSKYTRSLRSKGKSRDKGGAPVKLTSRVSGLVLTVAQFDSIPMADDFKVLQYWSFEPAPDAPISHTAVKVGFAVFYTKSSLFRSQIWSGIKEELLEQSSKWLTFASTRAKLELRSAPADSESEDEEHPQGLSRPSSSRSLDGKRSRTSSLDLQSKDAPKGPLVALADAYEHSPHNAAAGTRRAVLWGLRKEDIALSLLLLIVALMFVQMLDNRAIRAEMAGYKDQLEGLQSQLARNIEY